MAVLAPIAFAIGAGPGRASEIHQSADEGQAPRPPAFSVRRKGADEWFLDPEGKPFWSFGVDCVDPGVPANKFDPKNPAYCADKLFASPKQWANDTATKLTRWGFNSLGGWSDAQDLNKLITPRPGFPYFVVLHLGSYARAPFNDIFTEESKKEIFDAAHSLIPKYRDDPNLVGYFTDNELGWWGDTLFTTYLSMPPESDGKRTMMRAIRKHYDDRFDELAKDWITDARSFDELNRIGKMKLRPGGSGMAMVQFWLMVMGEFYYELVQHAVLNDDTRHLILGDRYCQFYELPIAQSSAPYLSVASTNFGATWNDGTFARFYLQTLHELTGKPVIVTEFYMGANENRSGNRNTPPAFPVVQTQRERAAAFAKNVRGLAKLPYVIGAHWFQFYDEPPKGRGDGENFNHGFEDIYGLPYDPIVVAAEAANPVRVHEGAVEPAASGSIPRANPEPMGDLKDWPRDRGFVEVGKGPAFADLYACHDRTNLYLSVLAMQYMDEQLYEHDRIPESERSAWTLRLNGLPVTVRFGGKNRPVVCDDKRILLSETPALQHRVTIRVPLSMIGVSNGRLHLTASLTTHSRGHEMSWATDLKLAR